jgi:hypothetical protein
MTTMTVGISTQTFPEWVEEFRSACENEHLPYRLIRTQRSDWNEQIQGIQIFLWRVHLGDADALAEAKAKIPLIERRGITCFPSARMLWIYDDKVRQTYLLRESGIAMPRTFISSDINETREFLIGAKYPLVGKTPGGASSIGVHLLRTRSIAEQFGAHLLRSGDTTRIGKVVRRLADLSKAAGGKGRTLAVHSAKTVIFQEHIPAEGDWRITTLGRDLVSVFRRMNRPNDFRASGSGIWLAVNEEELPEEACRLALEISARHSFAAMAYDFMNQADRWLILEMSYTFLLNRVYSETLFRLVGGRFQKEAPIPIGVMHLRALQEQRLAAGDTASGGVR